MVNFSLTPITLLALLDIVGSLFYLCLSIGSIIEGVRRSTSPVNTILKVLDMVFCPIFLLLSGVILCIGGWRLDPFLQLQQFFFHIIVGVSLAKETKNLVRNRQ
jgi:hypothetical protein